MFYGGTYAAQKILIGQANRSRDTGGPIKASAMISSTWVVEIPDRVRRNPGWLVRFRLIVRFREHAFRCSLLESLSLPGGALPTRARFETWSRRGVWRSS